MDYICIGRDGCYMDGIVLYGTHSVLDDIYFEVADDHHLGDHLRYELKNENFEKQDFFQSPFIPNEGINKDNDIDRNREINDAMLYSLKITFDNYNLSSDRPSISENDILIKLLSNIAINKKIEFKILKKFS